MHPAAAHLESAEAASWSDFFHAGGLSAHRIEGVTILSAPSFPNPDMNRAIGLGTVVVGDEVLLDRVIAACGASAPYYLQVAPDSDPPELHDWIADRGFTKRRRWVKLWRDTTPRPAVSQVRVETVDAAGAELFGQTMCTGFGFPAAIAPAIAKLVGRRRWRTYLAHVDGTVAGAGAMYVHGTAAHLAMGCALPEFRRRGVQAALIERRIADADAEGVGLLVTEAAEDIPEKPNPSLHNLVRLGFREAYKRENYQRG